MSGSDEALKSTLRHLSRRNLKLGLEANTTSLSSRRKLLQSLDTALTTPMTSETSAVLWNLDADKRMLAITVLTWATTVRRPGHEKIFNAVRILRAWRKDGLDVTSVTLDFLASSKADAMSSRPAFFQLIAELSRSEHFSVARYLEWLIARGGLHDAEAVSANGPISSRLIAELPVHNLTEEVYDLRATLLGRAEDVLEHEEAQSQSCMAAIDRLLLTMPSDPTVVDDTDRSAVSIEVRLLEASWTTKSEVGIWLRHKVKAFLGDEAVPTANEWHSISTKHQTSHVSLDDFATIKRCLLLMGDFSMLADILKLVANTASSEILASCADTLNLYVHIFSAIGALDSLFQTFMGRVNGYTERLEDTPRVLLVAFSDLAAQVPGQQEVAAYLKQELIRSDRKTAADACSPVSDHMALMQTAEADFSDEIERVLASGNSMDKGTLERLFQRIIMRLEESLDKTPEQQRSCSLLLTRLKTFDAQSFSVLLNTWVARFVHLRQRPSLFQILGPMVSFGCITLSDVIKILISGFPSGDVRVPEEALSLILPVPHIPEAMSSSEVCRLAIKQSQLQRDQPQDVLLILRRAMETTPSHNKEDSRLYEQDTEDLIKRLVLADTTLVVQELVKPLLQNTEPAVLKTINFIVDKLLVGHAATSTITAETILDLADDLSLPFCQLKLAAMFNSTDTTMAGSSEESTSQLEAFNIAIETAVSNGKTSWSSIVPLLDVSIGKHLRQRATTQFLGALPSLRTLATDDAVDLQGNVAHAKDLLHIVDVTAHGTANASGGSVVAAPGAEIPLALHNAWLILANSQIRAAKKHIFISAWLPLLLQFVKSHRDVFENTKSGNESRGKTIITLAAIYLELTSKVEAVESVTTLVEDIFDLALYLVDALPDDVRLQCIRSLRDTASLPRIKYLLSITSNPSEWLVLMQRERVVAGPPSANTANVTSAANEGDKLVDKDKPTPYPLRRWEMLQEPTPNIGENDTSLSLTLFGARKG
jgi:mediator of RNA polymerase II transcription subunit 12